MFTKNRNRLLTTAMARKVMAAILAHREVAPLLSDGHFSVDGTLIKGEKRSNGRHWGAVAHRARTVAHRARTDGATMGDRRDGQLRATMATMPRPPTPTRGCPAR